MVARFRLYIPTYPLQLASEARSRRKVYPLPTNMSMTDKPLGPLQVSTTALYSHVTDEPTKRPA